MALIADRFKFRPSEAVDLHSPTQALMFDSLAFGVVLEEEYNSYRNTKTPGVHNLSPSNLNKAQTRFELQEQQALPLRRSTHG